MKKLLLFIFLFIGNITYAQDVASPISKIDVFSVDSVSADELFNRAELWIAETFKNPDRVVKLKNRETHQIILSSMCDFTYSKLWNGSGGVSGPLTYTIKINTRDGRCRIEITDFYHTAAMRSYSTGLITDTDVAPSIQPGKSKAAFNWNASVWTELKQTAQQEANNMCNYFKNSIVRKDAAINGDW